MRQFSTITVGLCISCACAVALTASALASFQASDQRVSVVSLDGAPLKLAARVVSAADPPGIAYEATNLTNSVITDYGVRIYVYRSNGRPQGFTTKHEEPNGLQPGASYSSMASLGEIALAADSVVLVQVTTAAFDSGSRWMAPPDALERVKSEAAQLTSIAPLREH